MEHKDVPYIVFEGEMARHERTVKRLIVALVLTIALLFASNAAWLCFFNQFDFVGDTTMQEAAGNANYVGNNGDITNGEPSD